MKRLYAQILLPWLSKLLNFSRQMLNTQSATFINNPLFSRRTAKYALIIKGNKHAKDEQKVKDP
jgi:hypothetical protein